MQSPTRPGSDGPATLPPPAAPDDRQRALDLIYAHYVARLDAARVEIRRALIDRHSDLRVELSQQFEVHDWLAAEGPPDGAPEEFVPEPIGRQVAGYRLAAVLGRGGTALVYRAERVVDGTVVAVKMTRPGAGAADRDRLRAEAATLARLDHPAVVELVDAGELDGRPFLAVELVDGPRLADRLRGRPLEPRAAAALVRELADAAHYMHRQGFLHLDLNPGNVLLDGTGRPRIIDLGSARPWPSDGAPADSLPGTPAYMAPEQADGDPGRIGPWTDVFGLGGILYHALTGYPPFLGVTLEDTLDLVRTARPVPVRDLAAGVPAGLERVCLACLARDPADRFGTARDLALALASY